MALIVAVPLAGFAGVAHAQSSSDAPAISRSVTESSSETAALGAPTITGAYASDQSITVVWDPPAGLDAGTAVTYDISWLPSDQVDDPAATWAAAPNLPASPTKQAVYHSDLTNGTTYLVRVRAVTDHNGPWSKTSTVTPFERADVHTAAGDQPAIPLDAPIGTVLGASGTDVDLFKIVLAERQRLTLRTAKSLYWDGNVHDPQCRLLDSDGETVPNTEHGDFRLPPTSRHCFVHADLPAGTYWFEVKGFKFSSQDTAPARNRGRIVVEAATAPEPSTTTAAALPAPVGETLAGSFAEAGVSHFWRIDLAEKQFIDVPIVYPHGWVNIWVQDSSGAYVDTYLESIEFCFLGCIFYGKRMKAELAPGTYYLEVESTSADDVYAFERRIDHGYAGFLSDCTAMARSDGVNDALSGCQWHLDNRGQRGGAGGQDANVAAAHKAGYLGDGVHVAVVDAGIDLDHEDLAGNTDSSRSRSYCGTDTRPDTAPFSYRDDHGTAVAGVIAARDNQIGMRGVAPRATLYNRRLICSWTSDQEIADAMTHEMASICVSNNSWGAGGFAAARPVSLLFDAAIGRGVAEGCGGKGTSYVFSAGNGDYLGYDSNLEEYPNHYGVMAVCAVNANGTKTWYSEQGANVWVCAPSNDTWPHPGVATLTNYDRYRGDFAGTSAAAPVVAGTAALVRAANPALTWRDVKLIVAESARRNHAGDGSWRQGAAKYGDPAERYWHSRKYGFGVVDAHAAAQLAAGWTNVPAMTTQTRTSDDEPFQVPDAPGSISGTVTFDDAIEFVEFVQIDASLQTDYLRQLRIDLVSPSGTEVMVIPDLPAQHDKRAPLKVPFRFGVAGLLGEPAEGTWTLRFTDKSSGHQTTVNGWGITLYGHRRLPTAPKITEATEESLGLTSITAKWDAPAYAGASAITGYDLRYRSSVEPDPETAGVGARRTWRQVEVPGGAAATSHTLADLTLGSYEVQVRAKSSAGAGPWSAALSAAPKLAAGPSGLSVDVSAGPGAVSLDWHDVAGAAEYWVRWRVQGFGTDLNDGVRVAASQATIDVGAAGDWVVHILACNNSGCSPRLNRHFAVAVVPPRGAPTGLSVDSSAGPSAVSLDWGDVAGATEYWVRWRVSGAGTDLTDGVRVAASQATIDVGSHGGWVAHIQACNSAGCGPRLNRHFNVVLLRPSSAPTGLSIDDSGGPGAVSLDWDDVAGATEYWVRWRPHGWGTDLTDGVRVAASQATIDVGSAGGWVAHIQACNDAGCGPRLNRYFNVVLLRPAAAPTGLSIDTSAGPGAVSLDWGDVAGATEYWVRWRVSGAGTDLTDGVRVAASQATIDVGSAGGWVAHIQACNDAGCGPRLNRHFTVVLRPPSTSPTGLSVDDSGGPGAVSLDWDDTPGATEYWVRWRPHGWGTDLNDGVRVAASQAIIDVGAAGAWVAHIQACNSAGCGPRLNRYFNVVLLPPSSAPAGLSIDASAGAGAVSLDWDDTPGATEYWVRWRPHGFGTDLNDGVRVAASQAVIDVGTAGGWVTHIQACNAAGCGPRLNRHFTVAAAADPP